MVGDLDKTAVFPGLGKGGLHHLLIHLLGQFLWPHGHKVHPQLGRAHHPGVAHIIPHIAGEHHLDLIQGFFAVFLNGHQIR